ncbi:MAG: hypothetical protein H6Q37_2133 [Chloroflexi bacterium]|jgi:hypothetical protein|nr:hypothetical protein [Chloroflexota bacterium]
MTAASNSTSMMINETGKNVATFEPWQRNTLMIGGAVGAGVGLLAAYLLLKNSERSGVRPTVSFREGFQIAVLCFGIVRSISNLWEG